MQSVDDKIKFIAIPIGEQDQQVNVTPNPVLFCTRSFWDHTSNEKEDPNPPLFPNG